MIVSRTSFQKGLAAAFIFLGPLGNLLTPHSLPAHFRTYFFILLGFPLFFLQIKENHLKLALFFAPFFLYAFLSAMNTEIYGAPNEPFPFFRYCLLLIHFLFAIGASSIVEKKEDLLKYIELYINSYLITLFIGFLFFIGFYTKTISFSFIDRFSVLAQFGYGLLRFAPGSYANEYGIVTSFVLSIFTLLASEKKTFGKAKWIPILSIALFLTTTRAAFIAYFFCLLVISFWKKNTLKILTLFLTSTVCLLTVLNFFHLNSWQILKTGFTQKINEGSLGERYLVWGKAFEEFQDQLIGGLGFASVSNTHNVYLQLFFELGIVGSLLLLGTFFFCAVEASSFPRQSALRDPELLFLKRVQTLGLIHILWFAFSNHNLNHHLTWFVIFLYGALLNLRQESKISQHFVS